MDTDTDSEMEHHESEDKEQSDDVESTASESPASPVSSSNGKQTHLTSQLPSSDSLWQYFVPIHDSATGACITATCTKCLTSVNPKPYSLEQHLINSPSCGSIPTGKKNKDGAPIPAKLSSCFICGDIRMKSDKVGYGNFEAFRKYDSDWGQSIAESLCKELSLDGGEAKGEGETSIGTILGSGFYCGFCAQVIRDINWIHRTIDSFAINLTTLKARVVNRIGIGLGHKSGQWNLQEGDEWDRGGFLQNLRTLHQNYSPDEEVDEESRDEEGQCQDEQPSGIGIKYLPQPSSDEEFEIDDESESSYDSDDSDSEVEERNGKKPQRYYGVPCPIETCPRKFKTLENAKLHVRIFHEKESNPYHCLFPNCDSKFDVEVKLTRHQREEKHSKADAEKALSESQNQAKRSMGERQSARVKDLKNAHMHQSTRLSSKSKALAMESEDEFMNLPSDDSDADAPTAAGGWKLRVPCPVGGCLNTFKSSSKANLHARKYHGSNKFPYPCRFPGCKTKFETRDKLSKHEKAEKHAKKDRDRARNEDGQKTPRRGETKVQYLPIDSTSESDEVQNGDDS